MANLFNIILMQPLINLLVVFYNWIPDIGVVIVLITVLIRILLLPSFNKSLKSQKQMTDLQPKLNEVREKYKDNKEEQAKAMMELYKAHSVNPLSSCLPLLIQLPLLIALYRVFIIGLGKDSALSDYLYKFVSNPGHINPLFLGYFDLSKPYLIFGILAGVAQFVQSKMMIKPNKGNDMASNALAIQTVYFLPILTIVISLKLPAGLPLYWIATTLFAIAQQYYIIKSTKQA